MSFRDALRAKYGGEEFMAELEAMARKADERRTHVEAMSKVDLRDEVARLELRFLEARSKLSTALRLMRPGYNDVYMDLEKLTREDP